MKNPAQHALIVLEDFLAFLRTHGFEAGVDTHLKVTRLLEQIEPGISAERLKTYLAPLLVHNREQQQDFYRLYDQFFARYEQPAPTSLPADVVSPPVEPVSVPRRLRYLSRRRYYLIVQLLLVLGLGYLGTRAVDCYRQTRSLPGTYFCAFGITPPPLAHADLPQPQPDSLVGPVPVTPPPPLTDSQALARMLPLLPSGPLAEDISDLQATMLQQYSPLLKILLIFFVLTGFLFYEMYLNFRRRWFLMRERSRYPPYFWTIRSRAPAPPIEPDPEFYQAGQNLRMREPAASRDLDLDTSVDKTVQAGGYPQVAFQQRTRPPEYLVLIEQRSPRDHLARFYDHLIEQLRQQDLYIERYFYGQDPRLCWQERYQTEVHLEELHRRFPDHRLVIVGDAAAFFDPIHDELCSWTALLGKWAQVAVLSPENPLNWGRRELTLSSRLLFLPATIPALGRMPDLLTQEQRPPLRYWVEQNQYPPLPDWEGQDPAGALKAYFDTHHEGQLPVYERFSGRDLFMWLCSCAIYPELSWDLTLALGQALAARHGQPLTQPEQLYQLFCLPWFREGEMPAALRAVLIRELPRAEEQAARRVIVRILKENPPPAGSFAETEHALLLAAQEAQLYADLGHNIRLVRRAQDFSLNHEIQDFTVAEYLRSLPKAVMRFSLPDALNRLLFRQGISALGLRTGVRAALVVILMAVVSATFDSAWLDHLATFEEQTYFLRDEMARMRYHTYVGNAYLAEQRYPEAEDNYQRALLHRQAAGAEPYLKPAFNLAVLRWEEGEALEARDEFARLGDQAGEWLRQDSNLVMRQDLARLQAQASYNEGVIYYRGQETEAAEEAFRDAVKRDSLALDARYAEAVVLLHKALESQGANQLNRLTLAANKLEDLQRLDTGYLAAREGLPALLDSVYGVAPDRRLRLRYRDLLRNLGQVPPNLPAPVVDLADSVAFHPRLEYLSDFVEGLALVRAEGKYGFVDAQQQVRALRYEDARPYAGGLAAVRINGRWGYVNARQEVVIPCMYDQADDFHQGWASVKRGGGWGMIDRAGKVQLPFRYDRPVRFEPARQVPAGYEPLAAVSEGGRYYYIDREGNAAFGQDRYQLAANFEGAYARVKRWDEIYHIDRRGACVPASVPGGKCPTEKWESRLVQVLQAHEADIDAVTFSPDGRYLVTAGADQRAVVWRPDGLARQATLDHGGRVRALAVSPDSRLLASVAADGKLRVWRAPAGTLLRTHEEARGDLWAVAFSPDQAWLAAAGAEGTIWVYRVDDGQLVARLRGHRATVTSLAFVPGTRTLVSGSEDGSLRLWDVAKSRATQLDLSTGILSLACSPDGAYLAVGTRAGQALVYDLRDPVPALALNLDQHRNWVSFTGFSAAGRYLFTCSYDQHVRVWNLAGDLVLDIRQPGTVRAATFSPDGQYLVTAAWGRGDEAAELIRFFRIERY